MRPPQTLSRLAWILMPIACAAYLGWCDHVRIRHVEAVTAVAEDGAAVTAASPTGYADGKRWLIVPEHNNPTYQWIEETQLMAQRGDWRVRSVDYENSPQGRDVHSASPYRWWLVALAAADRAVSGRPLGLALEHAALYADPLLQLLLLAGAAAFAARRFGGFAGALVALCVTALYPLGAAMLPGVANDFALSQIAALWSILLAAAAVSSDEGQARRLFAAGCAGGCGLWLSAEGQVPAIAGIAAGAVLAAILGGRDRPGGPLPWRAWAYGGAISGLLAYLAEYFPSHMEPQLRVNYPLYGLAWIGLGELLWRLSAWRQAGRGLGGVRGSAAIVLSAAALASLPVALVRSGADTFLSGDLQGSRLTNLPNAVVASSISEWFGRGESVPALVATLLPLLILAPAVWMLVTRAADPARRASVAVAVGPVLVLAALAGRQIRLWNTVDCAAVALVAVSCGAAAGGGRLLRWLVAGAVLPAAILGVAQSAPSRDPSNPADFKFTTAEIEGLYERAVSQWIADHAGPGGATVLVPPYRTSSFCFYGGLRGLGTPNWENREGLSAEFRIVNSTRPDETLALLNQRGVTHIVVPSWDNDFDTFAKMGLKKPTDSFIYALHQTDGGIFPWLRALPYSLPEIPGFKDPSVLVLEVTDETDQATLRSRLVEYLVEMHRLDQAAFASQALFKYPADLGALVALAQVAKARGDDADFGKVFASMQSNLASGSDRSLAWDRRVSLAVVLALGGRMDLSLAQARRCADDATPERIRMLTTGSLYHLLVLCRHFGIEFRDPALRALSLHLLPSELRARL